VILIHQITQYANLFLYGWSSFRPPDGSTQGDWRKFTERALSVLYKDSRRSPISLVGTLELTEHSPCRSHLGVLISFTWGESGPTSRQFWTCGNHLTS